MIDFDEIMRDAESYLDSRKTEYAKNVLGTWEVLDDEGREERLGEIFGDGGPDVR